MAAYVELAAVEVRREKDKPPIVEMPFPAGIRRRMKNKSLVPVVSLQIPVDPSGRYTGLCKVVDFDDKIKFAGGINAPKVIKCIDDHGVAHRQLVKGGSDDMRQVSYKGVAVCASVDSYAFHAWIRSNIGLC